MMYFSLRTAQYKTPKSLLQEILKDIQLVTLNGPCSTISKSPEWIESLLPKWPLRIRRFYFSTFINRRRDYLGTTVRVGASRRVKSRFKVGFWSAGVSAGKSPLYGAQKKKNSRYRLCLRTEQRYGST